MNTLTASWLTTMGRGVKVMVLDTAIPVAAPAVPVAERRSYVVAPDPHVDHGEKVAQVLSSTDPMNLGVAPGCTLYGGEVVGRLAYGWRSFCDALQWAIDLQVDVLNMSFAWNENNQTADAMLATLDARGCICVASYNRFLHWPHSVEHVLCAGMPGQPCDLSASGDTIVNLAGTRTRFVGTSASAAQVSGLAACAKASSPAINRAAFIAMLKNSG